MVRRVLDTMLLKIGLMHELLVTLMAEVTGIVNSRPIATIPSDTEEPQPLTPAMLPTMKTAHLRLRLASLFDKTSKRGTGGEKPSTWPISFG